MDGDYSDECHGGAKEKSVEIYLDAHTCVPFEAASYQHGGGLQNCAEPQFKVKMGNSDDLASSSYFLPCKLDNCKYGYTGPKCQYYVSDSLSYCNGYGSAKRGKRDDFIGCSCKSREYLFGPVIQYKVSQFCERDVEHFFFPENGLSLTVTGLSTSTETIGLDQTTIEDKILSLDPYSTATISGYIRIPQSRTVGFRIKSTPGAKLTISTTSGSTLLEIGQLNDVLECDPTLGVSDEDKERYFSYGNYTITIEYNLGCALHSLNFEVYWRIKKYDNSDQDGFTGNWEEIPIRYLGVRME